MTQPPSWLRALLLEQPVQAEAGGAGVDPCCGELSPWLCGLLWSALKVMVPIACVLPERHCCPHCSPGKEQQLPWEGLASRKQVAAAVSQGKGGRLVVSSLWSMGLEMGLLGESSFPEGIQTQATLAANMGSEPVVYKLKPTLETMPLEIKHEIFSYLLLGRNLKVPITDEDIPTFGYAWDKAILRVNKRIGEEAKVYLYSANTFVVVKFLWHEFDMFRAFAGVGLLFEHEKFKHHQLEIYFQHGENPAEAMAAHIFQMEPGSDFNPWGSFVLLHEDFTILCQTLQLFVCLSACHAITIMSKPDVLPVKFRYRAQRQFCAVSVSLENTTYSPTLTENQKLMRQKKILEPLSNLCSSSQRVRFDGGVDDKVSLALTKAMTPTIAWFDALGWNLHERLRETKMFLDEVLQVGCWNTDCLCTMYMTLALKGHSDNSLFEKIPSATHEEGLNMKGSYAMTNLPHDQGAVETSWQLGVVITVLECYMTCAAITMKHRANDAEASQKIGDYSGVAKLLLYAHPMLPAAVPAKLACLIKHLDGLSLALAHDGPATAAGALSLLDEAAIEHPRNRRLRADIAILRRNLRTSGRSRALDFQSTALKNIRLPCRYSVELERPTQFQGHRDMEHELNTDTEKELTELANKRIKAQREARCHLHRNVPVHSQ